MPLALAPGEPQNNLVKVSELAEGHIPMLTWQNLWQYVAFSGAGYLFFCVCIYVTDLAVTGMGLNAYFTYNVVGYYGTGNVRSPHT